MILRVVRTRVKVIQADIDKGERGSYCDCPIALALRRTFGRPSPDVVVDLLGGWVRVGQQANFMTLTVEAFVRAFDQGQSVKPFEFDFEEIVQ